MDDASVFPDLGETIPVLMRAKELTGQNGKFAWSGGSFPAGDYSLRGIDPNRYKLLLKDSGKEITEMDEMQAFREIHPGAVYLHGGVQYQVVTLDLETRTPALCHLTEITIQRLWGIRILRSFMEGKRSHGNGQRWCLAM